MVGSDVVGERVEADDDELLLLVMELILVMYALMLASWAFALGSLSSA